MTRGSAESAELLDWVAALGVDVVVGAELLGEIPLLATARQRDNAEAHASCVLNAQVPQSADTQDADQVTCARR